MTLLPRVARLEELRVPHPLRLVRSLLRSPRGSVLRPRSMDTSPRPSWMASGHSAASTWAATPLTTSARCAA
eukprot:8188860-Pyramimonas_sp.AAC.1